MGKERKVISFKNLPSKPPITWTIVILLALTQWKAPEWVWGTVGLIVIIVWALYVWRVFTYDEKEVDIFKDKP